MSRALMASHWSVIHYHMFLSVIFGVVRKRLFRLKGVNMTAKKVCTHSISRNILYTYFDVLCTL